MGAECSRFCECKTGGNPPVCRNCGKPIPPELVRDGADACSVRCVREFVLRGGPRPAPRRGGRS